MKNRLLNFIEKFWYGEHYVRWVLIPFSLVYLALINLRRTYFQRFHQHNFSVPIIVVGNITVGGVGKTPLVIALANEFKSRGLRVGIVSRGYGAGVSKFPYDVRVSDTAFDVGDEPLLLARKTGCPVIISPQRVKAVAYLLKKYDSQIVISDDGLQHYAMGRAIEIVVIDGQRGLGNRWCLPAGPLRESEQRLQHADLLVVNGGNWSGAYRMDLVPGELRQLKTGESRLLTTLNSPVAAIAAVGNPLRFFTTLNDLGVLFTAYPFPDHYQFSKKDFCFAEKEIVMTEKDAVKCEPIATEAMYVLPVDAVLCAQFWDTLWGHKQLKGYI